MSGLIKISILILFILIMLLIYFVLLKSESRRLKKFFETQLKNISIYEDSVKLREEID